LSEWRFVAAWRRCSSFFGEPRHLRVVVKRSDRRNWCACIGARRKQRIDLFAESVEPDPFDLFAETPITRTPSLFWLGWSV
jgi:hypothetical protein